MQIKKPDFQTDFNIWPTINNRSARPLQCCSLNGSHWLVVDVRIGGFLSYFSRTFTLLYIFVYLLSCPVPSSSMHYLLLCVNESGTKVGRLCLLLQGRLGILYGYRNRRESIKARGINIHQTDWIIFHLINGRRDELIHSLGTNR